MEKDETERLHDVLSDIMSSRKLIESSVGPVWLIYPTIDQKIISKHVHKTFFEQKKREGIPTVNELLQTYRENGLWTDTHETALKELPKQIEELQQRKSSTKNRATAKKLDDWLIKRNQQLSHLMESRNQRLANSAEFLANDAATAYLISQCVLDINNNTIWPSYEELMDDSRLNLIDEMMAIFIINTNDSDEKTIRKLARSGFWRVRWNIFKKAPHTLFERSAKDLTNDQFMLLYWSQVYDGVYESLERPPDDIVNDDEALDEWLLNQEEERKQEVGKKFYGKGSNKDSKINKASEIFKVVSSREEAEKINALNSTSVRNIRKAEEKKLRDSKGRLVQEHELRKNRKTREAMGGGTKVIKFGAPNHPGKNR